MTASRVRGPNVVSLRNDVRTLLRIITFELAIAKSSKLNRSCNDDRPSSELAESERGRALGVAFLGYDMNAVASPALAYARSRSCERDFASWSRLSVGRPDRQDDQHETRGRSDPRFHRGSDCSRRCNSSAADYVVTSDQE
jgi:hypothetical protein